MLKNVDLIQTCQTRDSQKRPATRQLAAGWRPSCGQWWKDGAILENTGGGHQESGQHPRNVKKLGGNSNIFYFHPYLGKTSNLTNIFQMG